MVDGPECEEIARSLTLACVLPALEVLYRVLIRMGLVDPLVVRRAQKDEVGERSSLVVGHRLDIAVAGIGISNMGDLVVDDRLRVQPF